MFSGIAIAINILMATLFGTDLLNGQLSAVQLGLGMAVALVWAGGMVWTGLLLADKSLRGGHFALGFIAISLVASFDFPRVIFSAASLAILAAIWKHLE